MSSICDDLRAAILQAAMQGKLTERLETDDSSERIKEQIVAERSRYKNCKFLDNSNDSVDFPDEWQSLKAGEVFELLIGEKVASGDKLPLLDAKYFRGKQKTFTNKGNLANKDDVLILVDGENSGETFLCIESGYMGSTFKALFIPKCLNKDFALYFLEMNRKVLRDNKRGSAIPHLDKKLFFNFVFPIPPLAEQKRIVEKVDELMARVADLEQSADALASLKKAFPDDIKASLLQAAMQGKLTKQLPEDGNAEELLDQIKAEKERLIAEGKIKKQKSLAPIANDEVTFMIPKNWSFCRVGDLFEIVNGAAFKPSDWGKEGLKIVRIQNLNNPTAPYNLTNKEVDNSIKLHGGELLFAWSGTPGTSFGAHVWNGGEAVLNQHIFILNFDHSMLDIDYLKHALNSTLGSLINKAHGSAGLRHVTRPMFEKTIIPIPPLTEQKRIVERVNTLMQNIDVVGELIASE